MRGVLRLGLTGGIGSGKSTVAAMLARRGAVIIDADAISRQTTAAGGPALPAIAQAFGAEFVTAEGALDRSRMRDLAFSDPTARRRLEQIVHPLIGLETLRQTQAAIDAGQRCIVLDIPLLVESTHWRPRLDQILVVDCRPDLQIERVMQRSNLDRTAIVNILASQSSRANRLCSADVVICNDELSMDQLDDQVQQVANHFGL